MENSGENGVHPLLRGGRPPYRHGFSPAQMQALAAICDTFVPSISPEMRADYETTATIAKEVDEFYRLSGSENGVPDHVAGLITKRVIPIGFYAVWVVLWLLSTRLGTFLLCGRDSACNEFPFLQNFAGISQANREKILLRWSQGAGSVSDLPFKLIFKLFKSFCLFAFYSTADASGSNPAWKAIGYSPPDLPPCASGSRPLEKGVIDVSLAGEKLPNLLRDAGFHVTQELGSGRIEVECDAVVVGSGSGGGVAAAALAGAGYRVLVLEKGKYYARHQLSLLEGPSMDQMHEAGGVLMTQNANVMLLAGSTVGGGTAVNWSAAVRTPPAVLREWSEAHGLALFQRTQYREAMDTVCARLGVQDACDRESFQNSILRKGCSKLGYAVESVPRNAPPDHFCGSCHFGCSDGAKAGTAETWLADAVAANALILAGCTATAVLLVREPRGAKKRRAEGVVARVGEGPEQIIVRAGATVVACGTLFTPRVLRASGLRNRNIGENLHLHLSRLAWGYFPAGAWPEGVCYEGGIITTMSRWERSGCGIAIQTPAFYPGNFSVAMPWISGTDMKQRMLRFSRTAHVYAMVRDTGSGRVARNSFSYRFARADKENLACGLERALRALIAAGAVEVGTHQSEGERFRVRGAGDDEIEEFLGRTRARELSPKRTDIDNVTSTAHQMGSCRMGIDPETSAVDEKGETWEARGLFVCDASVFPTALGVNPMVTVQSVALCVSASVLHFLQSSSSTLNPCS